MATKFLILPTKWICRRILIIVSSGLCANSSFSQTITWLGSGFDTFSNNPASWSGGVLPTASSEIVILNGSAPFFVNAPAILASVTFLGDGIATRMTVRNVNYLCRLELM